MKRYRSKECRHCRHQTSGLKVFNIMKDRTANRLRNSCTHALIHCTVLVCKAAQPTSSTDLFAIGSFDLVPYDLYRHVAKFLQWCVRKCASPILPSHKPCRIYQDINIDPNTVIICNSLLVSLLPVNILHPCLPVCPLP